MRRALSVARALDTKLRFERAVGVVLALILVAPVVRDARAVQPTWAEVRTPLYGVLHHGFKWPDAGLNARQGIWRFNPTSSSWSRLTPFFYNCRGNWSMAEQGRGSYLTATGDALLFEGYGAWVVLDPASGRLVRRYSPYPVDTLDVLQVKGPAVSGDQGAAAGLLDGVYGFPTQAAAVVCPGCADLSDPFLFWQSTDSSSRNQLADLRSLPEGQYPDPDGLTFDPLRSGFWLGREVPSGYVPDLRSVLFTFLPANHGALDMGGAVRFTVPHPQTLGGVSFAQYDPDSDWLYLGLWEAYTSELGLGRWKPGSPAAEMLWTADPRAGDAFPFTLTKLPRTPPSTFEQTIPILVRSAGRNGTFWSSDLWLYNPSPEATTVTLRRVVKPAVTRSVELPGHGATRIDDALEWIGGGASGDGVTHDAIVLSSPYRWGEQVVASARVWTPSLDETERARGGTMGQAVPAVPGTTGYSNHLPASLAGLPYPDAEPFIGFPAVWVLDHRVPGQYRHNLGLANDSNQAITVALWWGYTQPDYMGGSGGGWSEPGGTRHVTVPAHGVTVVGVEELFPAALQATWHSQLAVTGDQPVAMWLSQVDNTTGDGIHVPYSLLWMKGDDTTRVTVPVVGHLPGAKGTVWRTDLVLPASAEDAEWIDRPFAFFHPAWPATNCGGAEAHGGAISGILTGVVPSAVDYPYRRRSIFPDVVHLFEPCQADQNVRGALEVRSSSWMAGFARTYTSRADGGTYGEMLPFFPPNGWPVQHFAGIEIGAKLRVNLGLFNGDKDHAITHRLTLYATDGAQVAQRDVVLQPWASVQERLETMLGRPLNSFPAGTYGLTVLPLDDQANSVQGRSWAYVSLVDNVTGDPTNWW